MFVDDQWTDRRYWHTRYITLVGVTALVKEVCPFLKQQPGTAGPGNTLGCCVLSFHFLWAIHPIRPVVAILATREKWLWGNLYFHQRSRCLHLKMWTLICSCSPARTTRRADRQIGGRTDGRRFIQCPTVTQSKNCHKEGPSILGVKVKDSLGWGTVTVPFWV